jgi:hypothetical protein
VDLLHIAEIKVDTKMLFLLTLNAEGVKTQSFFDAVLKFNWLARRQRDSGKIALRHREMKGREGRAGVLGGAQIKANRNCCRRQAESRSVEQVYPVGG